MKKGLAYGLMGFGLLGVFLYSKGLQAQSFLPPSDMHQTLGLSSDSSNSERKLANLNWNLRLPPGAKLVQISNNLELAHQSDGIYSILAKSFAEHPTILIAGKLGGKLRLDLRSIPKEKIFEIPEQVVTNRESNPYQLSSLPKICPQANLQNGEVVYQASGYDKSKGVESLILQKIELEFDYEDKSIAVAGDPSDGKVVYEEEGGFYSNLHYYVFPYNEHWQKLHDQLHPLLMQKRKIERQLQTMDRHSLAYRHLRKELAMLLTKAYGQDDQWGPYQQLFHNLDPYFPQGDPALKVATSQLSHGFLPGAFQSSAKWGYSLCEWGDTNYHSPHQAVTYQGFRLWQWNQEDKLMLVVVEGDDQLGGAGHSKLVKQGLLRPGDYTDDVVGIFLLDRHELNSPKTYVNSFGDFKITLANLRP